MSKFIELTENNDQPVMINTDNIVWLRPYKGEEENGTMIFFTTQDDNDSPASVYVKEDYSQVTKLISR